MFLHPCRLPSVNEVCFGAYQVYEDIIGLLGKQALLWRQRLFHLEKYPISPLATEFTGYAGIRQIRTAIYGDASPSQGVGCVVMAVGHWETRLQYQ